MNSLIQKISILVLTLIINAFCQDGFNDQNILRAQQAANEGQINMNTGFNNQHGDSNSQTSLNGRYQMPDDANNFEYNRERGRNRKVYRIRNPFQTQQDEAQIDNNNQDSDTSASNQYAGMQYSLPPEEFLQQMRAENQYHQQQQQLSTQASAYSYTATPQPQYLYSAIPASNYDNQPNQNSQEAKSMNSYYNPNLNSIQYNNANSYNLDTSLSTPSPSFLSTSSNQMLGTPANTYVSSSSPMYITSPPNLQPSYVSSPYSNAQAGTVDYNGNRFSTLGNNIQNYDNHNISNKKVQVDHYGNSGNALRYSMNSQNQYQNYPSTTMAPISSPYSEELRENWQNTGTNYNNGFVLQKSNQDSVGPQYSTTHYRTNTNQDDYKQDSNYDNLNQDTQRYSNSIPANNNVYYNYIQSHQSQNNNMKGQLREADQQIGQTVAYSHGDYGWKLDRKPLFGSEISTAGYSGYQLNNAKSDNEAVSQVSFQMDTSRPYNYNQISKSSSEKLEADEFVRAAAKAHDNYKQQLEANRIASGQFSNNAFANIDSVNSYNTNYDKIRNKYENLNTNSQTDYVTASPYYSRESYLDHKQKQPFDHDKVIKNIVPIDVSNVVQSSNAQLKSNNGFDSNDKYSMASHNKDQVEQNLKQYNRPTNENYYNDKNNMYSFSIKTQPDEYLSLSDRLKQIDSSPLQQGKSTETVLGYSSFSGNKGYADDSSQINNYGNHNTNNQDNSQSSGNIQQQILQKNPISSDIASLLKLNDIPLRLTQNLNTDSLRFHLNNYDKGVIPSPLPVRINQNLEQHHVDVATDLLNKLIASKQNANRQEADMSNGNILSTIHGFKVANPFNIDLKLVADMLKGKPVVDDNQLASVRDQFSKPLPIKFDLSQIQQLLLKNENLGNSLGSLGTIPSSYFDIYSNNRYPYQGIKYSRSEEEAENIPIAESSNSHPIGAVVEEVEPENSEASTTEDDTEPSNTDENRHLKIYNTNHRTMGDRYRYTNTLARHLYQRKYPKSVIDQPHPVLKPPASHKSRSKGIPHTDKTNRKRRVNKPRHLRFFKTEPLFEANTPLDDSKPDVSTLLKPPPVMEDKSDVDVDEEESLLVNST